MGSGQQAFRVYVVKKSSNPIHTSSYLMLECPQVGR